MRAGKLVRDECGAISAGEECRGGSVQKVSVRQLVREECRGAISAVGECGGN